MPTTISRFLACAIVLVACAALVRAAEKPNVVFLFADEHRYQSMGFTETPEVKTPTLDRMARQGVSFTNAISNYPVCSPFRAILLTGRWPYQTGVIDNNIPLADDAFTIADAFAEVDYATGYIGKWHLGGVRAELYGFDESLVWTGTNTHYDKAQYHPAEGAPVTPEGYNATLMTDQAIDFLERHRREAFFLMVSLNPPHANFRDAPEVYQAMYPEGSIRLRPNAAFSDTPRLGGAFRFAEEDYLGYHAHVSAVDHEVGRLLETLDRLGLAGKTIVFYSSDHGSMLGSHNVGSKRQPYEESIRIPFIIHGPGVIDAQPARDELIGAIDFMPTVLGAAGIAIPDGCEGRDFSPWLFGKPGPDPEYQLTMHISKENASHGNEHPAPIFRGLRSKTQTYAVNNLGPLCFFDNETDPYQQTTLADAPSRQPEREAFNALLRKAFTAIGDPFFQE